MGNEFKVEKLRYGLPLMRLYLVSENQLEPLPKK